MFAKQFSDGESFRCAGNDFLMLLPRDETSACEAVLQIVRPGGVTPPNRHESFMQIYLVWSGEANVFIGAESRKLAAPAIAFVPPRTDHWVENALADRDLQYLYISVWPNGIPAAEFDGGWKKVYAGIIDEYVSRGFPVEGKR
jgi:quercetin dioxygenase-like cupin family protein